MYRKAFKKKITGAAAGTVIIALFLVFALAAAEGAVRLLFAGVLLFFMVLLLISVIKYIKDINDVKARYSGDLEADLDNCMRQVNDKYFFFDDCFIDLANARMINYSDIKKVSGFVSKGMPSANEYNNKRAGAMVTMRLNDGRTVMISDFGSSAVKSSEETIRGYRQFCEYLEQLAPHAVNK